MTFDRLLRPGPLLFTNWTARHGNEAYAGAVAASAAGSVVTCQLAVGFADFGPDVVHYSAATPDVVSTYGVPAAAFTDFPIT